MGELVAYLRVDDSGFTGKINSAGAGFAGFAANAAKYGAAIGAAAAAAGVALYKVGSTFDDVSDTIRVGTGATGTALDGLIGSAKNIGREVPAKFSDIGVAVADLNTRLGLTGQPLEAMSTQFLNLSRITGTDLSSNIQGLTRVFGDWSIATDKQPGALDAIFRASQATGVGVDKLGQQVVQFGAPLRQLGFGFEESLAMLGSFDKAGVNTEVVMGSMRIALGKMARAGEDPASTFQRVSEEIKNAGSAGEANALALELFGAKAGPDMAAAIREGRFELGGLVEQIAGGSDTINKAATDTASFAESWQVFKNRALLAVEPIATRFFTMMGESLAWFMAVGAPAIATFAAALSDTLGPALSTVAGAVTSLTGFLQEHSTIVTIVAAVIAAVLIPHLVALGVAATISAARQVAAWLLTQAVTLAVAAIHSAQVVGMVAKWALLAVQSTVNAAKIVASWVATSAGAIAAGAVMVAQVATQVARWAFLGAQSLFHAAKVAAAWLIAMGPIGLVIAAVIGVVALIVANWDTIRAKTEELWKAVKDATGAAWDWIKGAVKAGVEFLVGLFTNFTGPGLIIKHWDAIKDATRGAWDAVKGVVSGAIDAVKGAIGGLAAIPGKVAGWFGGARDAAGAALNSLVGIVAGIPGRIVGALGNLGGLLVGAGKSIVQGLVSGIRSMGGAIKDVLLGLLPGPLKKFAGALGIASPSKVFAEFGQNIGQGLVAGIDATQSLVARSMTDLTDVGGMRVGGPSFVQDRLGIGNSMTAAASGPSVVIHGNVGWDPDEVARRIDMKMRDAAAVHGLAGLAAGA